MNHTPSQTPSAWYRCTYHSASRSRSVCFRSCPWHSDCNPNESRVRLDLHHRFSPRSAVPCHRLPQQDLPCREWRSSTEKPCHDIPETPLTETYCVFRSTCFRVTFAASVLTIQRIFGCFHDETNDVCTRIVVRYCHTQHADTVPCAWIDICSSVKKTLDNRILIRTDSGCKTQYVRTDSAFSSL